jgi:hypothetical protein
VITFTITVPLVAVAVLLYALANPEKAEKVAGWLWRPLAGLSRMADKKAIAYSVQGDINTARARLMKNAPQEAVLDRKLKVKWAKPEEAQAHIRGGDVIVFMKKAPQREENIANAVVAYLPRAVLPRARRYVDRETMRAVDLTLARSILQVSNMPTGALDVFFERHLDPALAEESELHDRLEEIDAIDVHGWLTRVLLNEYRVMGERLYPSQPDDVCVRDARSFCNWLGKLATRKPYDFTTPLKYQGRYLSAGIVFVALKGRLETEGLDPYRKQAKRLIYQEKCDVVYLMARDANISAVKDLADILGADALVETVGVYEYRLRSDFSARFLHRERAAIVSLRRRKADEEQVEDDPDLIGIAEEEIEIYDFGSDEERADRYGGSA